MSRKIKSFLPFLLVLATGWIVACPGGVIAQSVDCNGTLASWRITHPDYAKNCKCQGSNSMPVCSQPGSAGSSSSKGSGKKDFNMEIKKELISNIIQNVFAPPKNDSQQQEELLRKQQEEELARQKREQEELERQKIFERNKAELLGTMKGGNSASGLKLKGGGEELLTDSKPVSDSGQTVNVDMKNGGTPQEIGPTARPRRSR